MKYRKKSDHEKIAKLSASLLISMDFLEDVLRDPRSTQAAKERANFVFNRISTVFKAECDSADFQREVRMLTNSVNSLTY